MNVSGWAHGDELEGIRRELRRLGQQNQLAWRLRQPAVSLTQLAPYLLQIRRAGEELEAIRHANSTLWELGDPDPDDTQG